MTAVQQAARWMAGMLGRDSRVVRSARPIYERLLSAITANRGISWTINGTKLRISPFQRHRMAAIYDAEVARYLSHHIQPGAVCIDVGANVGVYALQFARWTGPRGRVVAFEPNPIAAGVLARHVRMNDVAGCVQVVQGAVSDKAGVSTFHMSDADGMSRLGSPNPEIAGRSRATTVSVTTLDEFCDGQQLSPDWLLVDVEGFEFAVLSGARRTLARMGGRLTTIVEMHPNAWSSAGWSRKAAEALLDDLKLIPSPLTGQADPLGNYGHVLLRPRV